MCNNVKQNIEGFIVMINANTACMSLSFHKEAYSVFCDFMSNIKHLSDKPFMSRVIKISQMITQVACNISNLMCEYIKHGFGTIYQRSVECFSTIFYKKRRILFPIHYQTEQSHSWKPNFNTIESLGGKTLSNFTSNL